MHTKVLSLLSFPVASTSKENTSFFLSPSNGELRCPPHYPSLKQPLAETSRVFSNPAKIPQWILPPNTELNRVLFLCLSAHCLNALLAELYRTHSRILLCTLCTCSMPTWQSFTELLGASVCNCVLPTQPCLLRYSATS
jgi:hypothetical protein